MDLWVTTRPTKDDSWGEPANLGPIVNSEEDDISACLAPDGLSLWFHSRRAGGLGLQDMWVTTRSSKNDSWGEPVNLGSTVNSKAEDGDPCISPDGLALFFFSNRTGGQGRGDLWVTTRKTKTDAWKTPANLGPEVNSEAQEWFPSISADDSFLYFFSNRPRGAGQTDIWQVSISGPGLGNPKED
jgi:Tol biopolymer transport system component